jgi:PPM family protein phosphatase
MGGHAAGEVASKMVIAALAPLDDDAPGEDLLAQLRDATLAGNNAIAELVASDPDLDGMGTTLTAMLFAGSRIGMVHVGDSRAYMSRGGHFSQITHDDTFVQSLIDSGRITQEDAAHHPQRSLVLKALTGHDVELSLSVREARVGDRYLICSDGLSDVVTQETIAEAIQIPEPQACADRMIELALKGGGTDNVTVIIADVIDVDFGEDAPIVGGAAGDGSDEGPQGDSPAARARALTQPRPEPQRIEPTTPPPDPKAKRRKRFKVFAILVVVLALLAGGAFTIRYFVMRNYFVGEAPNGEIAIFQGVPGSVLGISLNRQVQGSCDPALSRCDLRFVDQLDQSARDTVRNGSNTYESIEKAREFINRLRFDNVLPQCPKPSSAPPAEPAPSSAAVPTSAPPAENNPGVSTTPDVPGTLSSREPVPGVDCWEERRPGRTTQPAPSS